MTSVRPSSSGTVTPLAARAVRKPPTWASEAVPSIISSMAQAACLSVRSTDEVRSPRTSGQVDGVAAVLEMAFT